MTTRTLLTLTTSAAVGSGVVGGVFFAFSSFVMPALDHLPPAQSIRAMQAINRAAPTAAFMTALFGTALACVVLGGSAVIRWGEPGTAHQLVGAALSSVAVILTIAVHVPRNDALALVDPDTADAARTWATYARAWTAWNHLRAAGPIAGATVLALGLRAA